MTTQTAETVASAPTEQQHQETTVEAKASDTWTTEQLAKWNETGEIPKLPTAPGSASGSKDKKTPTAQDSAPASKKSAETGSGSAPEKAEKSPHRKDKEDTDRRFKELSERVGALQRENDELKRQQSGSSEKKPAQASPPVPDEPKAPPPLKQFLEGFFAEAANKGKSYEEGVEAWQEARDKHSDFKHDQKLKQALANEQQRIQQEGAAKEMQARVDDGKKRYADFDEKVWPALSAIVQDKQVPDAVKIMLGRSDVLVDLVYALGKDNVETFIALAKSDPGTAIEKLVELQADVRRALKGSKPAPAAESKPSSETKGTSETKAQPKPPAEVGGRGTATESPDKQAARDGNFSAFDAEMRRRYQRA